MLGTADERWSPYVSVCCLMRQSNEDHMKFTVYRNTSYDDTTTLVSLL